MNKNESGPHFQILTLITTPKHADYAEAMFKSVALPIQYRLNAKGTPTNEIIDILGLGNIDKSILITIIPKDFASIILNKLQTELNLDYQKSGIAFTIDITGANSFLFSTNNENTPHTKQTNRKDEEIMSEEKRSLIVIIVSKGYSSEVMDTARAAGATGGTVVHGRRVGDENINSFLGLSIQEEKDIILIVSHKKDKLRIMRNVSENHGINTDANGIVLSLPVESVIGLL